MTKKVLLIIGIVIIIGVAFFLFWESRQPTPEGESRVGFSLKDFLPFGKSDELPNNTNPTTDNTPDDNTPEDVNKPIPRLRKISKEPVAGAVIFSQGSTTVVRFVEKGTGNVYEARSDSNKVERLTNTLIPKIIRAFWLPNGSGFISQTLMAGTETEETTFVRLIENNATGTPESVLYDTEINQLPTNIKEVAVSPDSSKLFYYIIDSYKSDWYISNPDGTESTLVLSHSLSEWLPQWVNSSTILMQTKSTSDTLGYNFYYDVKNKTLKKIGSGVLGLSANPKPDASTILISSGGNSPQLYASSTNFGVNTLAEKCVWLKNSGLSVYCAVPNQLPKGNYPEDWYKGIMKSNDSIRKIDTENLVYSNISDLSTESGEGIDAYELRLSPDETHIIFRNKIDGFLWMLRI